MKITEKQLKQVIRGVIQESFKEDVKKLKDEYTKSHGKIKEKATKFLDGMWAFSYYDKINKKIVLSRDKFGEKPLYFTKSKNFSWR